MNFFESLGSNEKDIYKELGDSNFARRLEKHELKFEMKNGLVKQITPSTKSIQSDVLNVQRGVLSMIQLRQVSEADPEKLFTEVNIKFQKIPFLLKRYIYPLQFTMKITAEYPLKPLNE